MFAPSSSSQYQLLESGIHFLTLLRADKHAANDAIGLMHHLFTTYTRESGVEVIHYIMDFSAAGPPPLNYLMLPARQVFKKTPKRAPTRAAFLMPDNALSAILTKFGGTVGGKADAFKMFAPGELNQAIRWVLQTPANGTQAAGSQSANVK